MQNTSSYQQMQPQLPESEQLKCPRCGSTNTKFCYYNNYNLSQPRHFCKNCKRYWTKGGSLRNIPIGGATRKKTKRSSSSLSPSPSSTSQQGVTRSEPLAPNQDCPLFEATGSFCSLLGPNGSLMKLGYFSENLNSSSGLDPSMELQSTENAEAFSGAGSGGDSSSWGGGNGWPHLAFSNVVNAQGFEGNKSKNVF